MHNDKTCGSEVAGIRHYTCVGVGVGPANLSLAALLYGHGEVSNVFLDKRPAFGWHDDQLLPNTTLQVSMLKDLVSLAEPTNQFSFLSYLHAHGRIYHFINARFDAVPRQEFRNYLKWASEQNPNVVFGEQVLAVEFDGVFRVRTSRRELTADNLSVGIGRCPWVPPIAANPPTQHQFHVSEIVSRGTNLGGRRVCVVGGGQSGAEAFLDLISRGPGDRPRRVAWVSRRQNFFPLDDSPFTNEFYTPGYSEHHFGRTATQRAEFNAAVRLSSDGISESTLRQVYQRIYACRFIEGNPDLVMLCPGREVVALAHTGDGWDLRLSAGRPGTVEHLDTDVIIWATGYRVPAMEFLDPIRHRLDREGDEFRIDQDFAVRWDGPANRNLFVHNAAERQRGLADRNLSLIAWRSQRIVDRLRGVRTDEQLAPFIGWAAKTGPGDTPAGAPR